MKRVLLIVLVGCISMLQAQKLEKTSLKIDDLKWTGSVSGFGSDNQNYYLYYARDKCCFIVNKKLTSAKKIEIPESKGDRFLKVAMSGEDIVAFISRYKKRDAKGEVVMKTLNKTTGKFKSEKIVASFPMKKSDFLGVVTTVSPDKNKTAFLFVLADKKGKADSYYVMVMDEFFNMEWSSVYGLEISNESFDIKDFVVTNKGELYVAFFSYPENIKKAINKKSYINLMYLTEETKEKMTLPLEKYGMADIKLKPLKSGDVYMAAIFSVDDKSYASEFFSMKINGRNFNDAGSNRKEIEEKNTHVKFAANQLIPNNFLYYLQIEGILELNNGDIAVLCEQGFYSSYYVQNWGNVYVKVKGSVNTFFVNGNDASIGEVSVMEKFQFDRGTYGDAKLFGLSIFPFVYGNKVAYLFNDNIDKYNAPAKYKSTESFQKDPCIVLSTQENGEKQNLDILTGNKEADRTFRYLLFQEEDRLIVLTQGKAGNYIETLSLP
jgi:hypothetical protein